MSVVKKLYRAGGLEVAQKQYDFIAGTKEGIYMADGGKRSDTFMRRGESGKKRV